MRFNRFNFRSNRPKRDKIYSLGSKPIFWVKVKTFSFKNTLRTIELHIPDWGHSMVANMWFIPPFITDLCSIFTKEQNRVLRQNFNRLNQELGSVLTQLGFGMHNRTKLEFKVGRSEDGRRTENLKWTEVWKEMNILSLPFSLRPYIFKDEQYPFLKKI